VDDEARDAAGQLLLEEGEGEEEEYKEEIGEGDVHTPLHTTPSHHCKLRRKKQIQMLDR